MTIIHYEADDKLVLRLRLGLVKVYRKMMFWGYDGRVACVYVCVQVHCRLQ